MNTAERPRERRVLEVTRRPYVVWSEKIITLTEFIPTTLPRPARSCQVGIAGVARGGHIPVDNSKIFVENVASPPPPAPEYAICVNRWVNRGVGVAQRKALARAGMWCYNGLCSKDLALQTVNREVYAVCQANSLHFGKVVRSARRSVDARAGHFSTGVYN